MVSPLNFFLLMKFITFKDLVVSDIYKTQVETLEVISKYLKTDSYVSPLEEICSSLRTLDHSDENFCTDECMKIYRECEHTPEIYKCVNNIDTQSPEKRLYFEKCQFSDEIKNKIDPSGNILNNKCFITRTAYRGSWVDAAKSSCYCTLSNSEPCTSEDLNLSPQDTLKELEFSEVCMKEENETFPDNIRPNLYVSLSNMKKLSCPELTEDIKMEGQREKEDDDELKEKIKLSIGEIKESELESYCQYGPLYSSNLQEKPKKDEIMKSIELQGKNYLGQGYIFCKFKDDRCKYTEFSEWSECTHGCISYDTIPVKYRTRRLISNEMCRRSKLGTIEFEICTNLPPCEPGSWIKNEKPKIQIINYISKKKEDIKKYPEWIETAIQQYPDILEDVKMKKEEKEKDTDKDKDKNNEKNNKYEYKICQTQKVTTLRQTKCGCPFFSKNVKFSEFIENQQLLEKLKLICKENKENHLVFEGKERYIYYCNIDLVIKDLENKELKCEELDNREHIVCKYNKKIIKTLSMIKTFIVTAVPFIINITILTSSI